MGEHKMSVNKTEFEELDKVFCALTVPCMAPLLLAWTTIRYQVSGLSLLYNFVVYVSMKQFLPAEMGGLSIFKTGCGMNFRFESKSEFGMELSVTPRS